jgi:hypothetical protein
MSDFTAIREASKSLRALLNKQLDETTDPQLPSPSVTASLVSPKELDAEGGLSLWLYRVVRNPELTNTPPTRIFPDKVGRPPLLLDLYYLITPLQEEPEADQVLLGRVMQTFHDTPVLRGTDLTPSLRDTGYELRVNLEAQSIDQLAQVWQALQEPYQLSVCYQVQVVPVAPVVTTAFVPPVVTREVRVSQILSST